MEIAEANSPRSEMLHEAACSLSCRNKKKIRALLSSHCFNLRETDEA